MPTQGAYAFRLATAALDGFVADDNVFAIKRGEWAWIDRGEFGLMIYACCPDCGEFMTLYRRRGASEAQGHAIDGSGNLSPSVLHTWQVGGVEQCGFHSIPTQLLGFADKRSLK